MVKLEALFNIMEVKVEAPFNIMEDKLEAQFNIMEVTSELQVAYMLLVQAITNNFNLGNFNIQATY